MDSFYDTSVTICKREGGAAFYLSRAPHEFLKISAALRPAGVLLVSLEKRLDTSSCVGGLVYYLFGAVAHLERVPRLVVEDNDGAVVQGFVCGGFAGLHHELIAGHAADHGGAGDERQKFVRQPDLDSGGSISSAACVNGIEGSAFAREVDKQPGG